MSSLCWIERCKIRGPSHVWGVRFELCVYLASASWLVQISSSFHFHLQILSKVLHSTCSGSSRLSQVVKRRCRLKTRHLLKVRTCFSLLRNSPIPLSSSSPSYPGDLLPVGSFPPSALSVLCPMFFSHPLPSLSSIKRASLYPGARIGGPPPPLPLCHLAPLSHFAIAFRPSHLTSLNFTPHA